ncbi:hypothetical protein LCI18_005962 [Fusarium solani-melongenae]|uniref:Uncharacterized protein n=1 Tax=Fusarium solani subsp. cucurbitae TaxID=2747967 RepID=A0ACD3Z1D7_FUSSC|nr:hypothetical protein LCI18_005962 [Fusarium solani-melongenae]
MGASESKHSDSYYGPGQGWDYSGQGKPAPGQVPVYYGSPGWDGGQGTPNNSGQTYGQQAYGNPAYGQNYGQNLAPPNPPPYAQNPQGYGQPPPGQPMYGQRPQSSSGPPPGGYAQPSPQPRPQSYPPPNAPPQSHQMAPDRPFGLFASDFMVFLDGSSSQKTMTIGRHPGDVQYRADISFGAHHKMQLFRMNGMNQMLIAGAKGVGFTGSRINVNWADGRSTEMKSSDPSKIKFDVGGNTFLWVKAEKKEISGILGREAGKGFKLVRQGMEDEALAIFSQSAKFDYSKSSGWFCFVGRGASGQMGSDWANMAVLAMLKLWQIKALSKFAEITGEGIGAVAGAVGGG